MSTDYTRRSLLTTLALATGFPFVLSAGTGLGPASPDLTAAQLRSLLPDLQRARALGTRYRRQFPGEARRNDLRQLIETALRGGEPVAAPLGRDLLLARLDARVRMEFGCGDIVHLDGWILARTEARVCALCA